MPAQGISYQVGSDCPWSILNEDKVREIRRLYDKGVSRQVLADHYGVSRRTIWSVTVGETWRHVDGIPRHETKGSLSRDRKNKRKKTTRVRRQVFER